jgi:hypothetical protein
MDGTRRHCIEVRAGESTSATGVHRWSFSGSCAAGWRSKEAADVRVKGPKRKLRTFLMFDL